MSPELSWPPRQRTPTGIRYAAFPTRVLRETVTVWSYSLSSPESALQAGRPWSTYRAHMAALAVKLGMRRGKPCFVGRRTIHRSEVVLYLPAENGDSWDYDELVFDAPAGGELETREDVEAIGLEWLAMLETPRQEALMRYHGGPDLPAWGDPSWRELTPRKQRG